MKGVEFQDQNCVFNKPTDMTDEQCYALPAKRHNAHIGPGENDLYPAIDSVWELTDDELETINKTKRIRLTILGQGMPPVSLQVEQEIK